MVGGDGHVTGNHVGEGHEPPGKGEVKGADGGKDSDDKKTDETNFRKEAREEGKDAFIRNVCNHETKSAKTISKHIMMKHRSKPGDDSDEELEDAKKMKSDKFNESLMNEWDDSRVYTSTHVPAADILARYDDSGNRLMSDVTFDALNKEPEMVEENDVSTKVKLASFVNYQELGANVK